MERKKFIKRIAIATAALAVPSSAYCAHKAEKYIPVRTSSSHNPLLSPVPGTEEYPGTPLDEKGLFMNEEYVFWPKMGDFLKWQTTANPYKDEKRNYPLRLDVVKNSVLEDLPRDSITWLGHASFLIKIDGVQILTDPVLNQPGFFLKRYSELPFEISAFKNIDYILISHNHRDHCDKESIQLLAEQNPNAAWFCGLGLDKLLLENWTGSTRIQAAGWYQQFNISSPGLIISYLPTRHWSRRGLFDTNTSLWGAFMIEFSGKKIYFGGDSGYGNHFKTVRKLFGEVDYYIAGVGAFAPRWFMAPSHMHPEETAQSCNDLRAKNLLPMHFGTFDLSDEPLLEPARLIKKLKAENAFEAKLLMQAVGEPVLV